MIAGSRETSRPARDRNPWNRHESTSEEIRRLARLAHLELDDEECRRVSLEQVSQIVEYAQRIQRTRYREEFTPTSHALLAVDTATPRGRALARTRIDRDALLEAAPMNGDGLFKVPKVLP